MGRSEQASQPHSTDAAALGPGASRQAVTGPPAVPQQPVLPTRRHPVALPAGEHRPPVSATAAPRPSAPGSGRRAAVPPAPLPPAVSVLAVIARPGQESAELGAVLSAFALSGARLSVLCLTRGEASELNSAAERLEIVRPWELQVAASLLRISSVTVADYPDGRLGGLPAGGLAGHIRRAIRRQRADLLLVVDPAAVPDPDTVATAKAASLAARAEGLPVLARTRPGPGSRWEVFLGEHAPAVRARQHQATRAHASQHLPDPPRPSVPSPPRPSVPEPPVPPEPVLPRPPVPDPDPPAPDPDPPAPDPDPPAPDPDPPAPDPDPPAPDPDPPAPDPDPPTPDPDPPTPDPDPPTPDPPAPDPPAPDPPAPDPPAAPAAPALSAVPVQPDVELVRWLVQPSPAV